MALADEPKALFIDTPRTLKGNRRRTFMAQVVKSLGQGGQRRAERELNRNRGTVRRGMHELESGIACRDASSARGRKRAEDHLPNLLEDIEAIADEQSQTDATFETTRPYTRLSAAEVRKQLILQKGYTDKELPTEETIRVKLNELEYRLRSVPKSRPQNFGIRQTVRGWVLPPASPEFAGAVRKASGLRKKPEIGPQSAFSHTAVCLVRR